MALTPHGTRQILLASLFSAGLCAGIAFLTWKTQSPYLAGLQMIPLALLAFVLWFFRDPERDTPTGPGLLISPADGCVADITPVGGDSALGCDGVKIGIFMNVFNVHVNRMPCDARVTAVTHKPGSFLDVRHPDAPEVNESATLCLEYDHAGKTFPLVVRQISGLIARRIVTAVTPGETRTRGQRFGMIKFGSRVELFVPNALLGKIRVQIGQPVNAGLTILADTIEAPAEANDPNGTPEAFDA